MAVTATLLTSGSDTTNGLAEYVSASYTPSPNSLILVWVTPTASSNPAPDVVLTGNGLTWEKVEQNVAARSIMLFRAMGAAPTTGPLTITPQVGNAATSMMWHVVEFGGVDTSGTNGSGAIAQFKTNSANGINISVTLDAPPAEGNATAAGSQTPAEEAASPVTAGYLELADSVVTAPSTALATMWNPSGTQTMEMSGITANVKRIIGVEIKAAAGDPNNVNKTATDSMPLKVTDSGSAVLMGNAPVGSESTGLRVTETTNSFRTIVASDSGGLRTTDTGVLGKFVSASDSSGLRTTETSGTTSVATKTASDTMPLAVTDAGSTTATNALAVTQSHSLSVADVSNLSVQSPPQAKVASDSGAIGVVEASTPPKPISVASDMGDTLKKIVQFSPISAWGLDDATPFIDYSGHGRIADNTGTVTTAAALAADAKYSTVFTKNAIGRFTSPVFVQGNESHPFSLVAWVRPIPVADETVSQQILSHSGQYDGLFMEGTTIVFTTKYLTTGEARCEYDLQAMRRVAVIGVHTEEKNQLYVDGVLVSEVNISLEQQADQYIATDGYLYSGNSTGTQAQRLAANAYSIFGKSLKPEEIEEINLFGSRTVGSHDTPVVYGGVRIPMSKEGTNVFQQIWTTDEDWARGYTTNAAVVNGQLVPQSQDGLSVAGTWQSYFSLEALGVTSVYGVSFDWDGVGAVVEASLDGSTWEAAVRDKNLTIIPAGWDPTDKAIYIRISFTGGLPEDPSFVDNLTATATMEGNIPVISNRTITIVSGDIRSDYDSMVYHDEWGTRLRAGTLTIGPDPDFSTRTIEIWVKQEAGTAFSINVTGTTYENGTSSTAALRVGEWTLYHLITSAAVTGDIVISGDVSIGQVSLYETANPPITEIYQAYTGIPRFSVEDSSSITITIPPTAIDIYAYDWSITGGGG